VNFRLPDGDGVDVVKKILEEFPDTRVVMLSGSVDHEVRAQSMGPAAYDISDETALFVTLSTPYDRPPTMISSAPTSS
jgi:DNA-binding NarL/FixJ family response regulator